MRAPDFWTGRGLVSTLLQPLAGLQAAAGYARNKLASSWQAPVPVLCVGNLVAGGAGKTPVTLSLADILTRQGRHPHILTRGYGGRLAGPVAVDPDRHSWTDIGDEPLLLANRAPCWVARDRVAGARAAVAAGAELLLLDDGFQNPSLAKDWSMLVIDGGYGFGNRRILPAGPLREPVRRGIRRADAAVVIGPDPQLVAAGLPSELTVLHADLVPQNPEEFTGQDLVAFAGIGRPAKFYASLAAIGGRIVERRDFPDHHPYREAELLDILAAARRRRAIPVTTAKDLVRIPAAMRAEFRVLTIAIQWRQEAQLLEALQGALIGRRDDV